MANQIRFDVDFNVKKESLKELSNALKEIQQEVTKAGQNGTLTRELEQASEAAKKLQSILNESWNTKLNGLDLNKLNNSINTAYGGVERLRSIFNSAGVAGSEGAMASARAYNKFASTILNTNLQLKQSSKFLNTMAETMSNTIKWGAASSLMNKMTGSIQQAIGFTKSLDASLNDIRIVTNKSAEDMANFAVEANNAAKSLGQGTTDYTKASLIYYQQGLGDEEVKARTETTLKAANVTGQSAAEVSEQLTAVWNGYKVDAEEAELYVDKLAAVAATTASDLEELSTGMSRVASAAAAMGVDVDQLNDQLSTIISVTRQAPESVGTALRSIYARMGQLKVEGEDDFGVSLGKYTEDMHKMGIEILDEQGNMREMGVVIEEVADKWGDWTQAQRNAAAQAMAGTRQYNNLVALFDNWDMYTAALETSQNAMGTLQEQQDIYMESTAAHLQQLQTEFERTFETLLSSDAINTFSVGMDFALSRLNDFLSGIGGGANDFAYFGSLVANVFNNQIGEAIEKQILNFQALKANAEAIDLKQQVIDNHAIRGEDVSSAAAVELEAEYAQKILNVRQTLTAEEYNGLTAQQEKIGLLEEEIQLELEKLSYSENERKENESLEDYYERRINYIQQELQDQSQITEKIQEVNLAVQNNLDAYKQTQDAMRAIAQEGQNQISIEEQRQALRQNLLDIEQMSLQLGSGITLNQTERAILQKTINDLTNGEAVDLNLIQGVLSKINSQYEDQKNKVAEVNKLLGQMYQQQRLGQNITNDTQLKAQQQAISGVVKGVSALSMTLITLSGLWRTVGDDSLSAGEKMSRVFSTLLISAPILLTNIKAIVKMMPNLAVAIGAVGSSASVGFLEATGAVLTFQTALGPLWVVLLGIAAAIGTVAIAASSFIKAINAEKIALEEASKTAEGLSKEYESTKDSYDNLKDSLADYGEAEEALNKLTQGTEEWRDAVDQLNEKVLSLLQTYPELAEYISNENGLLSISEEGQNSLLEAQNQKMQSSYRANLMGQIYKNNAANAKAPSDLQDPYISAQKEYVDDLFNALKESGLSILESTDTLAKAMNETAGTDFYRPENFELLLSEYRDDVIEIYNQIQQREDENNIYLQKIGESFVKSSQDPNNRYGEQIATLIGQEIEKLYTDTMNKWEDKGKGGGGITDEQAQKQYAALMGYEDSKNKGKNMGEYLINGEWVEIADSVARAALAQAEAQEQIVNQYDEYASAIEDFVNTVNSENNNVKDALANFAIGAKDLSNLTEKDINELKNIDFSNIDSKSLSKVGFSDVSDLKAFRADALAGWNKEVGDIVRNINGEAQEAFKELDTSNLTLDEMQDVADILELAEAYGKLDEAIDAYNSGTLEDFAAGIRDVTDSLTTFSEFSNKYAEINKEINKLKDNGSIDADL